MKANISHKTESTRNEGGWVLGNCCHNSLHERLKHILDINIEKPQQSLNDI